MNKDILVDLYSTDPEFIKTYHGMCDMTIETAAEDTWGIIKNAESYVYDFGYFTIDKEQDLVQRLTGFFIKPEFRNKETYERFYSEVCSKTPKYFMSCAHKDNTKVVNFLKRMGGTQINKQSNDNMIYLLFKQENL
jgi:hypothetical protein